MLCLTLIQFISVLCCTSFAIVLGICHNKQHTLPGTKRNSVDLEEEVLELDQNVPRSILNLKDVPVRYKATWESLDTRPLPSWYDDAKLGIFLHWGVYSVPAYKSEWFWWHWKGEPECDYNEYMDNNYAPGTSYADLARGLTASHLNTTEWAKIVEASGAKYFVFTSKHHEGFTHWPSDKSWNWNSVDVGPHRNIVKELAKSFRKTNVTFGLYFSLYEWFNPMYLRDKKNSFKTQEFVRDKVIPQLYDLVNTFHPDYIWSDGDWETNSTYWNSTQFLAWLYNDSPVRNTVVVNDRWGTDANCNHGDVKCCADRYFPGKKVAYKWENAMTIDKKAWGFRKEARIEDFFSGAELIETLIRTVACGGNLLMNIAPTADGNIPPIFQERLKQMGDWLKINGEGIYGTRPWKVQKSSRSNETVWFTQKFNTVFALMYKWPKGSTLRLDEVKTTPLTKIRMLGHKHPLKWHPHKGKKTGVKIDLRDIEIGELINKNAWTISMENVK